jgi:hypothetical protein
MNGERRLGISPGAQLTLDIDLRRANREISVLKR